MPELCNSSSMPAGTLALQSVVAERDTSLPGAAFQRRLAASSVRN